MKPLLNSLFHLPMLASALGLMPASRVTAQTFNTLHHFTVGSGPRYANSDGVSPEAGLILSGNILYGTAMEGGNWGNGTVFRVNADGSGFTALHSFSAASGSSPAYINNDGAYPAASLTLSGNTLYGTAVEGGSAGYGTVFRVNTDGTGFTTLHSFTAAPGPSYTNSDGARPFGGVILSGSILYGTAAHGGSAGNGTVFKVNTDGTGFTTLYSFTEQSGPSSANSDGANPYAELVLSDGILYGTCVGGGNANKGTVFSIHADGTGFTTLHHFSGVSDGANPRAGLILSGNRLYGTAAGGGVNAWGTVFGVNINGGEFANLHHFTGGSDGGAPRGLIEFENKLYGTSANGGSSGRGTVFQVATSGGGLSVLYSFTAQSLSQPYTNTDGAEPLAGLVLLGRTLYGTASQGGSAGSGTIFSLSLPLSFAAWAASFGLSGAAAAVDGDPDADRLPNGAEYILGGNPAKAATSPSGRPAVILSGGDLLFSFSRDDLSETTDVILTVETGTDFVLWPVVFNIGSDTAASTFGVSISENGTAPDTVSVVIPIGTVKTKFARLKVTITP